MSNEERTRYLKERRFCKYSPTCIGLDVASADCKRYDGGHCDYALLKHDRERRGLTENHGIGGATEDIVRRLGI